MDKNFEEKINTRLSETKPMEEEILKEALLSELPSASSIEDLAKIKARSLEFDERTGNRMKVHGAIVKRFEELLRAESQKHRL